jgi:hypothetical protein
MSTRKIEPRDPMVAKFQLDHFLAENAALQEHIAKLERKISDNNQYMAERNLYILKLEAALRDMQDSLISYEPEYATDFVRTISIMLDRALEHKP